jgi:hypothetical protein
MPSPTVRVVNLQTLGFGSTQSLNPAVLASGATAADRLILVVATMNAHFDWSVANRDTATMPHLDGSGNDWVLSGTGASEWTRITSPGDGRGGFQAIGGIPGFSGREQRLTTWIQAYTAINTSSAWPVDLQLRSTRSNGDWLHFVPNGGFDDPDQPYLRRTSPIHAAMCIAITPGKAYRFIRGGGTSLLAAHPTSRVTPSQTFGSTSGSGTQGLGEGIFLDVSFLDLTYASFDGVHDAQGFSSVTAPGANWSIGAKQYDHPTLASTAPRNLIMASKSGFFPPWGFMASMTMSFDGEAPPLIREGWRGHQIGLYRTGF